MVSARARDEAWTTAKQVLGRSHAIFNPLVNGRRKEANADKAPLKAIIGLERSLGLIRWRQEQGCSELWDLTDQERTKVLAALRTLIASLQAYGVLVRAVGQYK
jgi:hypothetical protein